MESIKLFRELVFKAENAHRFVIETANVETLTNGRILLGNSIFANSIHAIRQTEQHPTNNFDRFRVSF